MTQEKMKVMLNLDQIAVEIEADPNNSKEILQKAQEEVIKQLQKKFPRYSYSVGSVDALTMETAKQGTIVSVLMKGKKEPETGIITGVNKKTIDVALSGGRILQGPPTSFSLKRVRNVEKYMFGKSPSSRTLNSWNEGDTAFINTGKEKKPVIIGKSRGKNTKAFIINGGGRYFDLAPHQLTALSEEK